MKKLYLTRTQAIVLADDLQEYAKMQDSNCRDVFSGFEISFGDMFAKEQQDDQSFEVTPIPNYLEIGEDS